MTRVLCPQDRCVFWDGGYCGADEITLAPEQLSCITMEDIQDLIVHGEDLDEWGEEMDEEKWGEDEDLLDEGEDEDEDEDEWEPF